MSTNAYLYRRTGTYYFRWSIPLALRGRMPPGEPAELRLSLRTTRLYSARLGATRLLLAALEATEGFLVSGRTIRYNELVLAIRTGARMHIDATAREAPLTSLGAVTGTVEVQALKDTIAHLNTLGARFFVSIPPRPAALWANRSEWDGSIHAELIERVEGFTDPSAFLTPESITTALAATMNLLEVQTMFSDLPGMWEGSASLKEHYEVRFDTPLTVNISALLVDTELAKAMTKSAQSTRTIASPDGVPSSVCDPIVLSKGLEMWLARNESWSDATKANYRSYVQQFIDIVGKSLSTTELTADHFDVPPLSVAGLFRVRG